MGYRLDATKERFHNTRLSPAMQLFAGAAMLSAVVGFFGLKHNLEASWQDGLARHAAMDDTKVPYIIREQIGNHYRTEERESFAWAAGFGLGTSILEGVSIVAFNRRNKEMTAMRAFTFGPSSVVAGQGPRLGARVAGIIEGSNALLDAKNRDGTDPGAGAQFTELPPPPPEGGGHDAE